MADGQPTSPGRPRDPDLERRALKATRLIYSEFGRKGVTFHQVALQSGVGKPALYRRWESPDDLIVDALADFAVPVSLDDVGDVTEELASYAQSVMRLLLDPEGAAIIRAMTEFHAGPQLWTRFMERVDEHVVTGTQAIIRRAMDRGELPTTASPETVSVAVSGGAMVEVLIRLHAGDEPDDAEIRTFCENLARFAVAGARGL